MKRMQNLATLTVSLFFLFNLPGLAQTSFELEGAIENYECGDNCYLTIGTDHGSETGLCIAPACQDWNWNAAMPAEMIGQRVRVIVGAGMRVDGAGNPMGSFIGFEKITFLSASLPLAQHGVAGADFRQSFANLTQEYRIAVQSILERLGYYKGASDGVWGPKTERAVTEAHQAMSGNYQHRSSGGPGAATDFYDYLLTSDFFE